MTDKAPGGERMTLVERLLASSVGPDRRDELMLEIGKIEQLGAPKILLNALVQWNDLMLEAGAQLAAETKRADSWVREARDLARTLGLEDDASNGSIADWKFIKGKLAAAEEDARRLDWINSREGHTFMLILSIVYSTPESWRATIDKARQDAALRSAEGGKDD